MKQVHISAIILTKDEEAMIEGCILSLKWCAEVIIIDSGSTDRTLDIAKQYKTKIVKSNLRSFALQRELAMENASQPWLLYIDADERVTPALAAEIQSHIQNDAVSVLAVKRSNYFFGQKMTAGGWQHDLVTRGFKQSALQGWSGEIHESPQYSGAVATLERPLIHFSHRNVVTGLRKTAQWTPVEAQLLADTLNNPVTFWTILRKGAGEFWRRAFMWQGWKDGQTGLIEALIQSINRMLVYMQVWELQAKPPIDEKYTEQENHLISLWKEYWKQHQA